MNENDDPNVAGDVQIYRNQGEVGRQLEHWYVVEVGHLALTGTERKVTLGLRGTLVAVEKIEAVKDGPVLLLAWLQSVAQHRLSVRTTLAQRGKVDLGSLEEQGVLPESVEGLIAYVGFDG